jgi:hypothetical protein
MVSLDEEPSPDKDVVVISCSRAFIRQAKSVAQA